MGLVFSGEKQRFIIADKLVAESLGKKYIIMLSHVGYWVNHYNELVEWCNNNNADVEGMTVNIHCDVSLTAFILKWQ